MTRREVTISIPAEHPALPGHFPGHPIVPGVVVLEAILEAAEAQLGLLTLTGIQSVKFLSPLLPGKDARGFVETEGPRLRFEVRDGDRLIAKGAFTFHLGGGEA